MKTIQTKHTPGPWRVENGREIRASAGAFICHVDGNQAQTEERKGANARLIAAAPELLAALEAAAKALDLHGSNNPSDVGHNALTAARAAIARAKGEA